MVRYAAWVLAPPNDVSEWNADAMKTRQAVASHNAMGTAISIRTQYCTGSQHNVSRECRADELAFMNWQVTKLLLAKIDDFILRCELSTDYLSISNISPSSSSSSI